MQLQDVLQEWMSALDVPLFHIGDTTVTVATLITILLIFAATVIFSRIVGRWFDRIARRRGVEHDGSAAATARLIHYTILIIGFGIALHTAGIDLTALFAAGAIFGVIIGFAMQNIASNFISGVILMAERSIKPGDVVEVDGTIVRIRELGIRSTIGRTRNEEDLIIPNANLVQSTVKNYTLRDTLYRIEAPVGVSYGSDMALVRSALGTAAHGIPWRSRKKEPAVLMTEFGSSSVNFAVSVWTRDPWGMRTLKSELNEAIWGALNDAGITIAFPQLDVHFDTAFETSVSGRVDT